MARFCLEIAKEAQPDVNPGIIQIEVQLDENSEIPVEYLNTNPSGMVSEDVAITS
jgi:hypothetical protein